MRRQNTSTDVSRRAFLAGMGAVGGLVAASCACGTAIGIGLLLNRNRRNNTERTVIVTATPQAVEYPGMVKRNAWGAKPPNNDAPGENGFFSADNLSGWRIYDEDLSNVNNTVVVHHSVVYEGDDLTTVQGIQTLHQEERGWADVGYHFLIGKNGTVYEGRRIGVRGVHVGGFNTGTIGVCLLGNFMEEQPAQTQINATQELITWLTNRFGLTHIAGHRDFNTDTQCPGDNLATYLDIFATNANLTVGTDGYIPPTPTD